MAHRPPAIRAHPTSRRFLLAGGAATLASAAAQGQTLQPPEASGSTAARIASVGVVDVHTFGAAGDGRTDDTAAIQAAIDHAIASRLQAVHLPEGRYLTTDTLHLGYGDDFHQVSLVGPLRAAFSGELTGATILPRRTDRPAINVQGGRNVTITGIALKGRLGEQIERALYKGAAFSAEPRDYLDVHLTPTGLDRFRPYAGITIDAYSGPRPAEGYPDVRLPAQAAALGQYNKRFSSHVIIEACDITGFAVGIASQPCDADGNGDFMRVRDSQIGYCIYGVAVCNGQSRNVELRNILYAECHTFLTTGYFGKARGELGGPIDNISGGDSYQFLDIPAPGFAAAVRVSNLYFERQVRIGRYGGGALWPAPIVFDSCVFSFGDYSLAKWGTGHTPVAVLECNGVSPVTFRQCQFTHYNTLVFPVRHTGYIVNADTPAVQFENCNFAVPTSAVEGVSAPVAQAINWFGGAFMQSIVSLGTSVSGEVRGTYFPPGRIDRHPESLAISSAVLASGQRRPLHPGAKEIRNAVGRSLLIRSEPFVATVAVDARTFPRRPVLAGRTLTAGYAATLMETPELWMAYEIEPGDLLFDPRSGLIFIVDKIGLAVGASHYEIEALLANGFHSLSNGTGVPLAPFATPDILHIIKTGVMLPGDIYFGEFTVGSTAVANVHRGDGIASGLSHHVLPGDRLPDTQLRDGPVPCPTRPRTRVVSVRDGAPGMIEMSRPAVLSGRYPILPVLVG